MTSRAWLCGKTKMDGKRFYCTLDRGFYIKNGAFYEFDCCASLSPILFGCLKKLRLFCMFFIFLLSTKDLVSLKLKPTAMLNSEFKLLFDLRNA